MTSQEILMTFYDSLTFKRDKFGWSSKLDLGFYKGKVLNYDLLNASNGKIAIQKGIKVTQRIINELNQKKVNIFTLTEESLLGSFISCDIIDEKTGKIFYEAGYEIDEDFILFLNEKKLKTLNILKIDNVEISSSIRNTLQLDKARSREEALFEIFKILRPGEPPTIETADLLFNNLFFNSDRYDLSAVGRLKINSKFRKDTPIEKRVIDKSDILDVIKHMQKLIDGLGEIDDIDHLGNRRVRSVGELLENQYQRLSKNFLVQVS